MNESEARVPRVTLVCANPLEQEDTDSRPEGIGFLQEWLVAAPLEEHQAGSRDPSGKLLGAAREYLLQAPLSMRSRTIKELEKLNCSPVARVLW
jgi:hypothetical protein